MERYHAFPGSGDGDTAFALQVGRENVFTYAAREGVNPNSLTVMRPGKEGAWVKFEDALKRSRKEYDEGFKTAKAEVAEDQYCKGHDAGLKQGRKEGQVKVDAISEISSHQLAAEFDRGHKAAISSKLVELIDSHKAESTYDGDLADAEAAIQEIVALLREYQDVQVVGERGIKLATKLTAFVNLHEDQG